MILCLEMHMNDIGKALNGSTLIAIPRDPSYHASKPRRARFMSPGQRRIYASDEEML